MEVYIIFTDTKTALSRMIKTYTKHSYSHVSISFDRELNEMYSFGRKDVDNAFIGGFLKEDAHNKLFKRADCAVYKYSVSAAEYLSMLKFVREMEKKQEQYKYNLTGLFCVMMNKDIPRENAYFCSQFVTEVLLQGGIKVSEKPSTLVMPRDIFMLENLDFAYSGKLHAYPHLTEELSYSQEEPCLLEAL